eukprot:scaffold845_cov231-Pinguiococcus_pyrenoidosus.AAC.5
MGLARHPAPTRPLQEITRAHGDLVQVGTSGTHLWRGVSKPRNKLSALLFIDVGPADPSEDLLDALFVCERWQLFVARDAPHDLNELRGNLSRPQARTPRWRRQSCLLLMHLWLPKHALIRHRIRRVVGVHHFAPAGVVAGHSWRSERGTHAVVVVIRVLFVVVDGRKRQIDGRDALSVDAAGRYHTASRKAHASRRLRLAGRKVRRRLGARLRRQLDGRHRGHSVLGRLVHMKVWQRRGSCWTGRRRGGAAVIIRRRRQRHGRRTSLAGGAKASGSASTSASAAGYPEVLSVIKEPWGVGAVDIRIIDSWWHHRQSTGVGGAGQVGVGRHHRVVPRGRRSAATGG